MSANMWKKDVENTIEIDLGLSDIYGASGFNLYTKFADEDTPTKQDVTFSELVEDIGDGLTITASGDTPKGSYTIGISDTSKVEVGMRFKVKDKDIYFYVTQVNDDSVNVRKATSGDIADGDEINQVGNMGIYEAKFTPNKLGALVFMVNNPSIGLQNETAKVQVVTNLVDDVAVAVGNDYNALDSKLSDIQASLGTAGATIVRGNLIV